MTDHPAAAPRRTLLTRGVWITIVAVTLALVATIVGGTMLLGQRQAALAAAQGPPATEVASRYLDAVIARDTAAAASLRTSEFFTTTFSGPDLDELIVGDAATQDNLGLSVDYEVLQASYLDFVGPVDDVADAVGAHVMVKINYSMTVEGTPVEAWGVQLLQLHRDNYDARTGERIDGIRPKSDGPTVPGPWRVSGIGLTSSEARLPELDEESAISGSNYAAPPSASKYPLCGEPSTILIELEKAAEERGIFLAECTASGASFTGIDPALIDFIAGNLRDDDEPDVEITGLMNWVDKREPATAPLNEQLVTIGDREFVFAFVMVDPKTSAEQDWWGNAPGAYSYRLVSVVERTK